MKTIVKILAVVVFATTIFSCSSDEPITVKKDEEKKEADFSFTPEKPKVDELVTFTANVDESKTSMIRWFFGDLFEDGKVIKKRFSEAKDHKVKLIVKYKDDTKSYEKEKTITVAKKGDSGNGNGNGNGSIQYIDGKKFESKGLYYHIICNKPLRVEITHKNDSSPFWNGDEPQTLEIPEKVAYEGKEYAVTHIGERAFYNTNLKTITMPQSIIEVKEVAFYDCSNLESVTFSNAITVIKKAAFYNTNLKTLKLPEELVTIEEEVFRGINIATLTIPNKVKTIGDYAFYDCQALTSVNLNNSLETVGEKTFASLDRTNNINIPASVKEIGVSAFRGLKNGVTVDGGNPNFSSENGILYNKNKTTLLQYTVKKTGAYSIPNGVTHIGDYAFSNALKLTGITIPASVTSLGDSAFRSCDDLQSITLPNTVKTIGKSAFAYCDKLKTVKLPESLEKISDYMFANLDALETIDIPNSVKIIGNNAFDSCAFLKTVNMGNAVETIGEKAFYLCFNLKELSIPATVKKLGNGFCVDTSLTLLKCYVKDPSTITVDATYVFFGFDYNNCKLCVPQGSVAAYKNASVWKKFKTIDNSCGI